MKKILAILVFFVVLIVGGREYLEYRYSSELKDAYRFAGVFASISHDEVKIDWDGSLSVKGLRILPNGLSDPVKIGALKFETNDRWFLLRIKNYAKRQELPEVLRFTVDRASFSTAWLELPDYDPNCRSIEAMPDPGFLNNPDYTASMSIEVDARDMREALVNFDAFDDASEMTVRFAIDARDIYSFQQQSSVPEFEELEIGFELYKAQAEDMMETCGEKFGLSGADFLDKVIASPKFFENSFGADYGDEARSALQQFFSGDNQLSIKFKPNGPIFWDSRDIGYLVRATKMQMFLNGESVPLDMQAIDESVEQAQIEAEQAEQEDADAPYQRRTVSYRPLALSDAKAFIGKKVRVSRSGGKSQIKGRLVSIEANRIRVRSYVGTGQVIRTIRRGDISQFEVESE